MGVACPQVGVRSYPPSALCEPGSELGAAPLRNRSGVSAVFQEEGDVALSDVGDCAISFGVSIARCLSVKAARSCGRSALSLANLKWYHGRAAILLM
jgi:hypothetical protein